MCYCCSIQLGQGNRKDKLVVSLGQAGHESSTSLSWVLYKLVVSLVQAGHESSTS